MIFPNIQKKKVAFGSSNTSEDINQLLDNCVHNQTLFANDLAELALQVMADHYIRSSWETGIDIKVNSLYNSIAHLYRPYINEIVPRGVGVQLPLPGGSYYMINADNNSTILPEFGHIIPQIRVQEDKLRYIDGSLPDSLTIDVYDTNSCIKNTIFETDATRMVDGRGWVSVCKLNAGFDTMTRSLITSLPTDIISTSMSNNIRIIPNEGTVITQIGTTATGNEIYYSDSAESKPLDLHFDPIQSEKIYIHLSSSLSDGTYYSMGIKKLEMYYNEYEVISTFTITVYDVTGATSLSEASLRVHIPEILIQHHDSEGVYTDEVDDENKVVAQVDESGFITFSILVSNPTNLPPVISKIRFVIG